MTRDHCDLDDLGLQATEIAELPALPLAELPIGIDDVAENANFGTWVMSQSSVTLGTAVQVPDQHQHQRQRQHRQLGVANSELTTAPRSISPQALVTTPLERCGRDSDKSGHITPPKQLSTTATPAGHTMGTQSMDQVSVGPSSEAKQLSLHSEQSFDSDDDGDCANLSAAWKPTPHDVPTPVEEQMLDVVNPRNSAALCDPQGDGGRLRTPMGSAADINHTHPPAHDDCSSSFTASAERREWELMVESDDLKFLEDKNMRMLPRLATPDVEDRVYESKPLDDRGHPVHPLAAPVRPASYIVGDTKDDDAQHGAEAGCPFCTSANLDERARYRKRQRPRKENPVAFWNNKHGYTGPAYCKACSESFRSHLLRPGRNPKNGCSRTYPCGDCQKILAHFDKTSIVAMFSDDNRRPKKRRSTTTALAGLAVLCVVAVVTNTWDRYAQKLGSRQLRSATQPASLSSSQAVDHEWSSTLQTLTVGATSIETPKTCCTTCCRILPSVPSWVPMRFVFPFAATDYSMIQLSADFTDAIDATSSKTTATATSNVTIRDGHWHRRYYYREHCHTRHGWRSRGVDDRHHHVHTNLMSKARFVRKMEGARLNNWGPFGTGVLGLFLHQAGTIRDCDVTEHSNVPSNATIPFDAARKILTAISDTDNDKDGESLHGSDHGADVGPSHCTRARIPILPSPPHLRLGLVLAALVFCIGCFVGHCSWKVHAGLFLIVRPLVALGIGWFAGWLDPTLDFGIRHELEL